MPVIISLNSFEDGAFKLGVRTITIIKLRNKQQPILLIPEMMWALLHSPRGEEVEAISVKPEEYLHVSDEYA